MMTSRHLARRAPHDPPPTTGSRHRGWLGSLAAAGVMFAALVLAGSAVGTAEGRIAATTGTTTSFRTGTVSIVLDPGQPSAQQRLLFDEGGLYPGLVVSRCVEIEYDGSVSDARIMLYATPTGTAELGPFLGTTLAVGTGSQPGCDDFRSDRTLFVGTLDELWSAHDTFDHGIAMADGLRPGDTVTVEVSAEVVDDDAAQGLGAEFLVVIEARP